MNAAETIARAMAKAIYRNRFGDCEPDDRESAWINKHWVEYEMTARLLLRSLKGQPPHITDAGLIADFSDGGSKILDAMLEAMARS